MQVSVEKISSIERRLTIVVPANQVEAAYAKQMNQLAAKANIKGFRPGKVPMNIIQERFGADARKEALSEVIQSALYQAIIENKLTPVSTPKVESKSVLANQPLEFTASFEVLPEFEKIEFNLANLEKLSVEVSEADVDHVLEQLRKQYTKWRLVDREAKENDRIVMDYYSVFEGHSEENNKILNVPLQLGSKTMLPGFEEGLIGVKAGEERTLHLHFPKDYKTDDKAGKPVDFVVFVKEVYEADEPPLDGNFAKQLGIKDGNIEELKKQIKQSLEQERDRLVKEKLKEQVFGKLIELNTIEVPKSLVVREAKNIHDEVYPQHQHHDHHQHSAEETMMFQDIAKKRVALGLLIAEYAKQEKLAIDRALVEKRIEELASAYENPQAVKEWLSSKERRGGIEAQIMEDLVLNKLIEGIPVVEKAMSYAELKGIKI